MTARLHLARSPRKPAGPSFAQLKRAARQFKGSYAPKKERHALIRKWLCAVDRLGNKWLLAAPMEKRA